MKLAAIAIASAAALFLCIAGFVHMANSHRPAAVVQAAVDPRASQIKALTEERDGWMREALLYQEWMPRAMSIAKQRDILQAKLRKYKTADFHFGDMYTNTTDFSTWRFNGAKWEPKSVLVQQRDGSWKRMANRHILQTSTLIMNCR